MERMTRNGLLTLVAVLMALALVVRLENTAQAQVIYRPDLVDADEIPIYPPINEPIIFISPGIDGTTRILAGTGIGWQTNAQPGTIFRNLGTAVINASSGGAVISTTDGSPAIQNGLNRTIAGMRPRIYLVEITQDPFTNMYTITYGWAYADTPGTWEGPVLYDELPENIRDLQYPDDTPLAGEPLFPDGSSSVTLQPGYVPQLPPGIYPSNQAFTIVTGVVVDGVPRDIGFPSGVYDPEVLVPRSSWVNITQTGNLTINARRTDAPHQFDRNARTLIKTEGVSADPLAGVIFQSGTAIENYGALTLFDSRIEAEEVGIYHGYLRTPVSPLIIDDDGIISYLNVEMVDDLVVLRGFDYSAAEMADLLLYNTQIGLPGRIAMDSQVGRVYKPTQTTTRLYAGNEILNGRIIVGQNVTLSRNPLGAIIQGVNYANDPVTGIPLIDPDTGGFVIKSYYEYQTVDPFTMSLDVNPVTGGYLGSTPYIGIHAQPTFASFLQSTTTYYTNGFEFYFPNWFWSDIPGSRTYYSLRETIEDGIIDYIDYNYVSFAATMVYYNHNGSRDRYVTGYSGGFNGLIVAGGGVIITGSRGLDTSVFAIDSYSYSYSYIDPISGEVITIDNDYSYTSGGARIELNDNSWIFATDAGISFGSAGIANGFDATRVAIDNTSGIYAANLGITDRYSTIELWASDPPQGVPPYPEDWASTPPDSRRHVRVDGGVGYSGSWHEILVNGKIITGAPSAPNISGIQIKWNSPYTLNTALQSDINKLSNIFYYDPEDPDADNYGNVYYSAQTAHKFVAYDNQPNRVFWWKIDDLKATPLTLYDYENQRWIAHPEAPKVAFLTGPLGSITAQTVFTTFAQSAGIGIDIIGTSLAWEGVILAADADGDWPGEAPWSIYYGPTVRLITALGDDTLIVGGSIAGTRTLVGAGAAMSFGTVGGLAHVASVIIGENNDVRNLSRVLFAPNNLKQSAQNYQAFDTMTALKRSQFLYDPLLAYNDDDNKFHFDVAGVHGDIVSYYNAVVTVWNNMSLDGAGTWNPDGTWTAGDYGFIADEPLILNSFWSHVRYHINADDGATYIDEILGGVGSTGGASYVIGHRGALGDDPDAGWSVTDITGFSLVLDELLINYLAGTSDIGGGGGLPGNGIDYYGYAPGATENTRQKDRRHFREALARYIHYGYWSAAVGEAFGLATDELLAGYTLDGTLVTFTNGDIFSSNIYGGGVSDPIDGGEYSNVFLAEVGTLFGDDGSYSNVQIGMFSYNTGNIDLRFVNGTTLFNRNVIELVKDMKTGGSVISHYAGIRVRDVYVESTGHLLLNDAWFAVNPFLPITMSDLVDYAERLIIHDVLNEGIVSGNGTFEIAQRWGINRPTLLNLNAPVFAVNYFDGYFINRGVLAPGLPGFIGESEYDARRLEETAYQDMLKSVSQASGDGLWQQLMRGVPGGQFGTITVFGHLYLMDEHTRPVIDLMGNPLFNTLEIVPAGHYHATVGNDTIGDVFGKYVAAIANATSVYRQETRWDGITTYVYDETLLPYGEVSQEDWKIMATEKLGTHLAWFTPSRFVDKKTMLPLLTAYEQFEYLTDPVRRAELQEKVLGMVLTKDELRLYRSNPTEREKLDKKILEENNIRFEFTQLDTLLWRFGFSDVVSVHGTIPAYIYQRNGWNVTLNDLGPVPPDNIRLQFSGVTQLGGIVQADRIYDLDDDAHQKEKQTAFIIIASEDVITDSSIKQVTSVTTDWVFANVTTMPIRMPSGQLPIVLTVIDDPNYYRNRVSMVSDSFNAKSVASALDDAMLTNPGLALSFQFGLNSPEVLNDVFRQVAGATRANSLIMNLTSPFDHLFNQVGYGHGGLSTGNRGDIVFRNIQTGQLQQPYGQPAVPPPGHQYAPPMAGQYRGQSPFYRTGSVWGAYTGSFFTMGDDDNSFKYTISRNGAMVGNEWNLTPSSVVGGVATCNVSELQSLSDKVTSHDYTLGVYFVCAPYEQFEIKAYSGAGFQSYKMDRYIRNNDVFIGYRSSGLMDPDDIFGIDEHYNSETRGHSLNSAIEFARPFTINPNFVIRPAVGFEYQNVRQKAYAERMNAGSRNTWYNNGSNIAEGYEAEGPTGGTYRMNFEAMNFARTLLRLGANTESYFPRGRGGWQFRAYYVHRLTGDKYPESEQSFTSGSKIFNVRGAELGNSFFQVGTGLHFWLNQERTATFFANGDWNFSMLNQGYNMIHLSSGFMVNF